MRTHSSIIGAVTLFACIAFTCVNLYSNPSDDNLINAAKENDFEGIKKAVKSGASIKKSGGMALLWACNHCNLEAVKYLLSKRANVNAKEEKGGTPLHIATQSGCIEAMKMLIQLKANINAVDLDGSTPLMYSTLSLNNEPMKFLISKKANLNIRNNLGKTALGNLVMIKRIFTYGPPDPDKLAKIEEMTKFLRDAGGQE